MDIYKRLELDTNKLANLIDSYSSNSPVNQTISYLKKSIETHNTEETLYLLQEVSDWFDYNIQEIRDNDFVINKRDYADLMNRVHNYLKELPHEAKNFKIREHVQNTPPDINEQKKKIFISHSSNDKDILDPFIEMLINSGVPNEAILYSSGNQGIPADEDIFDYLRNHISQGITVFYMLSDNYYNSTYCLNEMGAAWITQNDFSTFLLPNFTVKIKGVIDRNKKAYDIINPIDLIQLKNKIQDMFDIKINEIRWETLKNKFINEVNKQTTLKQN